MHPKTVEEVFFAAQSVKWFKEDQKLDFASIFGNLPEEVHDFGLETEEQEWVKNETMCEWITKKN